MPVKEPYIELEYTALFLDPLKKPLLEGTTEHPAEREYLRLSPASQRTCLGLRILFKEAVGQRGLRAQGFQDLGIRILVVTGLESGL